MNWLVSESFLKGCFSLWKTVSLARDVRESHKVQILRDTFFLFFFQRKRILDNLLEPPRRDESNWGRQYVFFPFLTKL